jgi:dolichol-phosphate mannosyltransferase
VIDDGSTDGSVAVAQAGGARVISFGEVRGVGAAIREGYSFGLSQGHDVAVTIAGNNKDSPEEIDRLLDPIVDGADLVQGSRYLAGRADHGPMPVYRRFATKLHPWLFSRLAGRRFTDTTNGFRAIRLSLLSRSGIDLDQRWLDRYELEPYLLLTAVRSGARIEEVPVSKIYPPKELGQTKMKPVVGWWSILSPLVYVPLRLRR